jgi:predicted nucleic acid-binding protein
VRVALDTNVLAYAEGVDGAERRASSHGLLRTLVHTQSQIIIPVQVLGELVNVLVKKAGRSPAEAREAVLAWQATFGTADTTANVMVAATDLAVDHHLSTWDAVILAAAADAGCRLLLSEDMHEGFTWGGVTVANPFAPTLHPLFATLQAQDGPV